MEWFESEDFWRELYPFMFPEERFAAAREEVAYILALTNCHGGHVLDLCCGPGRHSLEFAQQGFHVTGVDRSPFLLEIARGRAAAAGLAVEWIETDMRRFSRAGAFDLACNIFTSFGYFRDEEDDLRVLRNVHASLRQGGALVIELLGKERIARMWQSASCDDLPDGSKLVQRRQLRDDWSRIQSEWILIRDETARTFHFDHAIYSGREIKDRLLLCGFRQVQLYGNLAGVPYGVDAPRLVAVARK
ncbi:MAG TPA: methyltransferase domain-containing protein [Candidatus Acidoferrales bacterium]|jgi:SAM-dependent methyltransferase|nr:methyltransferase domain-containing protein [Candidatus Acidoferrales bacterium]